MEFSGKNTGVGCHFLLQMLRIKAVSFFILVKICSIYERLTQRVIQSQHASSGPLVTPQVIERQIILGLGARGSIGKLSLEQLCQPWPHSRITRILRLHLEQYFPISGDRSQCWRLPGDCSVQPDWRDNLCRVLAFFLLSSWRSNQTKQRVMGSLGRLD